MSDPVNSHLPEHLCSDRWVLSLPVVDVLPQLTQALTEKKRVLLQAPPGAGKTTLVPLALLHQPWLADKKIIMLEPRRLAARASATHMATLLGEKPGQTVGYQVRMERCMGPNTRIEIITEGILTRKIQGDPGLEDTGLVIFDEFHERHIHGDLGLALTLESAEVLNPDLRLLIMSATMNMEALSRLMDDAPVILSEGHSWPVTTQYIPPLPRHQNHTFRGGRPGDRAREIVPTCIKAIQKGLAEESGDILVFLPGAAQIRALTERLGTFLKQDETLNIHPLFGNLSPKDQAAAIAPSREGQRKIVLATPIAETSLTIEGVTVVVDSGLAKTPKFSPGRGLTQLETLPVSRASADQRRGRAGRTAPGVCYRLWDTHVHQGLIPFNRPEILSADLTPLVLELAQWGVNEPGELKWLDPPPESAVEPARDLLRQLDALDEKNRITDHGRRLLRGGIHPRLAHMVIRAKELGHGYMGCCLAAMAEARDFLLPSQGSDLPPDPDITLRLEILNHLMKGKKNSYGREISLKRAREVLKQAQHLAKRFSIKQKPMETTMTGRLLAMAWPGRIAKKRRPEGLSYLMASGSGAFFRFANTVSNHEYTVAVHLDGHPKNASIFLAAPYERDDLEKDFQSGIEKKEEVVWDEKIQAVRAVVRTCYGRIIVEEVRLTDPDPMAVQAAMIQGISLSGLKILPWSKKLLQFRYRVIFLKNHARNEPTFSGLPDLSDSALTKTLEMWLSPFLTGIHTAAGLKKVDLTAAVKALFTWDQAQLVEAHAPTHITVPSGSRIPVQYVDENGPLASPVLAVRLQEMFGLMATPTIAKGKIPLTLHLLSPAGRPVQITQDLENFWHSTYKEVKKDLMGRYPKHFWPEDPATATPTHWAKPRKK